MYSNLPFWFRCRHKKEREKKRKHVKTSQSAAYQAWSGQVAAWRWNGTFTTEALSTLDAQIHLTSRTKHFPLFDQLITTAVFSVLNALGEVFTAQFCILAALSVNALRTILSCSQSVLLVSTMVLCWCQWWVYTEHWTGRVSYWYRPRMLRWRRTASFEIRSSLLVDLSLVSDNAQRASGTPVQPVGSHMLSRQDSEESHHDGECSLRVMSALGWAVREWNILVASFLS